MASQPLPHSARRNIAAVRDLAAELSRDHSRLDRATAAVSRFAGSARFLVTQAGLIAAWVAVNSLPGPVDPYPFAFLNFVLSVEAILLTNVVLMAQNRQGREADERAELHLQIGLLAEQETTKMLQMLQAIRERLGVEGAKDDPELRDMIRTTNVEVIAEELRRTRDEAAARDATAPPVPPTAGKYAGRTKKRKAKRKK